MSQNGFREQYKQNLSDYNRQAPWRFLRLLVAFGLTLLLAPCCAAAAAITGEPMAAMVVAVAGIVGVVIGWRVMLWVFDRRPPNPVPAAGYPPGYWPPQSPFAPTAMSGFPPGNGGIDTPFPTSPAYMPPAYLPQVPGQPIMGASSGPVPPFADEPPRAKSGAGCAIAAVAGVGLLLLSCCGGGVLLFAAMPNLKVQAGPAQPIGGPAVQPFGFPGPMPGMPGAMPNQPFPQNDPFEEMRRAQEKQFQDIMKENERQMREFDEQFRKQNERPFAPGFSGRGRYLRTPANTCYNAQTSHICPSLLRQRRPVRPIRLPKSRPASARCTCCSMRFPAPRISAMRTG